MSITPAAHQSSIGTETGFSRFSLSERLVLTAIQAASSRLEEVLSNLDSPNLDGPEPYLTDDDLECLEDQGYTIDGLVRMPITDGYLLRQLALSEDTELPKPLKDAILAVFPDERAFCVTGSVAMSPEAFNAIVAHAPKDLTFDYSYAAPELRVEAPEDSPSP
ncbi:hypothetical protein AA14337_2917 [Acetobacter malorum DSM 14337]|uniref:Uncharacterized protein n=1 Tax=Acetobacter malorum DSM 14337 TaxID=1307910 RepID=A0ABQ0PYK5_9PROT|nr:hypothetical protein [Acetobacter malorum]KXV06778.1 hypothetical protein AD930_06680 [Acetobacter malorum]GBQ84803.1 hypothetical protein AA14337_2917 [Acetobacter malorum DSM 14337]